VGADTPVGLHVDCVTGEAAYRPLDEDTLDDLRRHRQAAAEEAHSRRQQLAQARRVLDGNPDLAAVLAAAGLTLPPG
jgi:hypothetical protein